LLGATMKAITKGERSPWDRPCEHAQQRELWQKSYTVTMLEWLLPAAEPQREDGTP
jgi:hypothetical protein